MFGRFLAVGEVQPKDREPARNLAVGRERAAEVDTQHAADHLDARRQRAVAVFYRWAVRVCVRVAAIDCDGSSRTSKSLAVEIAEWDVDFG
jgi:hypothetical protein